MRTRRCCWGPNRQPPAPQPGITHAYCLCTPYPAFPAANSFIDGWGHSIVSGDVEAAFDASECKYVLTGETKMGGQVCRFGWVDGWVGDG